MSEVDVERRLARLLRLYPKALRSEHGEDLLRFLSEQHREARYARGVPGRLRFTLDVALDAARSHVQHRRPPDLAPRATRPSLRASRGSVGALLATLLEDAVHAVRSLRRAPRFTVAAALTLGLGIGAATTMFGAVDAVVLGAYRGVPEPDRLVQIWDRYAAMAPERENQLSVPNFEDYQRGQRVFSHLAALGQTTLYLDTPQGHRPARGLHASSDLLPILGVRPLLGRGFGPEADREGAALEVLLGHGFWQRQFGGDPGAVGSSIRVARFQLGTGWVTDAYEVVGVLPPEFALPPMRLAWAFEPMVTPDLVLPVGVWTWGRGNRGMYAFRALARLAGGVGIEQARSELAEVAEGIAAAHPETNRGYEVVVTSLPALALQVHGRRMSILAAASGLLLLLGCANVAGLLLGRALERERELALRSTLGAGSGRLFRQLLVESSILALLGGAAGVAAALGLTRLLDRFVPPGIHNLDAARVDARALGFVLLVSLATAVLFGLLPALRGARSEAGRALRGAAARGTLRGIAGLRALVVGQVAVAFVLLSSSALLLGSLAALLRSDPGFEGEGVVLFRLRTLPPPFTRFASADAQLLLYDEVVTRVRALPHVVGAAAVSHAPLERQEPAWSFTLADRPLPEATPNEFADGMFAAPGYFGAMGIEVMEGRDFIPEDLAPAELVPGAPLPELAVVVNDVMATRFWPGESALGKAFYWGVQDPERVATGSYESGAWDSRYPAPRPLRIVGVVRQVNLLGLGDERRLQFYTPSDRFSDRWLAVRFEGDPAAHAEAVRSAILAIDPEVEVPAVVPMSRRVMDAAATARFQLFAVGSFAVLAGVLACVGLFGVVMLLTRRRAHELGIRLAIGARPGDVLRMVLLQGLALLTAGLALGVLAFGAAGPVLGALLHGVPATDLRGPGAAAAILGVAALLALIAPAAHAARVDPLRTLKQE